MQDFIRINQNDKVAVALKPLAAGLALFIDQKELILTEEIPQGHKFALCAIKKDEPVIKYGFRIGYAKEDIAPGAWVHVHNLRTALGDVLEYKYEPELCPLKKTEPAAFMGYKRADGKTGVRNEIWILPTVGCVNSVAKSIETAAKARFP